MCVVTEIDPSIYLTCYMFIIKITLSKETYEAKMSNKIDKELKQAWLTQK